MAMMVIVMEMMVMVMVTVTVTIIIKMDSHYAQFEDGTPMVRLVPPKLHPLQIHPPHEHVIQCALPSGVRSRARVTEPHGLKTRPRKQDRECWIRTFVAAAVSGWGSKCIENGVDVYY